MSRDIDRLRNRQTRAADRVTGTWWCAGGYHHARGPVTMRRGRKVCQTCAERISRRHHR